MVEKPVKLKKRPVNEKDMSILLQRYPPTTVLALLQEVAQVSDTKIDWNELVKNTSTGISNAREYQMLWRHLAYRHSLLDNLGDENAPLEDDSDIECELEPFPSVGCESQSEAAACVKAFISSGSPSDLNVPSSSTIEAPLTITLPRSYASGTQLENLDSACSMQGVCITVPVSVQRQPILVPSSTEGLNGNGSSYGNNASRRKRKPWSEAEDLELIAAVKKCGEGNWANILRGDFMGDRTASQLSQRWAIIKKRHGNLNVGVNSTGTQLSEVQLAARHAMSLALDRHVGNLKAARIIGSASANTINNGGSLAASEQAQDKLHESPTQTKPSPIGSSRLAAKSEATSSKKMVTKSSFDSDSIVRAAAVAAGARIASPADAASLMKAAQSKNAIHIMAKGPASGPGRVPNHFEAHPKIYNSNIKPATLPNNPTAVPGVPRVGHVKTAPTNATSLSMPMDQNNVLGSGKAADPMSEKEVKAVGEIRGRDLGDARPAGQKNVNCLSKDSISERLQEVKSADIGPVTKKQATEISNCSSSLNMATAGDDSKVEVGENQVDERQNTNNNEVPASSNDHRNKNQRSTEQPKHQATNAEEADRTAMETDGCSKNSVVSSGAAVDENLEENT